MIYSQHSRQRQSVTTEVSTLSNSFPSHSVKAQVPAMAPLDLNLLNSSDLFSCDYTSGLFSSSHTFCCSLTLQACSCLRAVHLLFPLLEMLLSLLFVNSSLPLDLYLNITFSVRPSIATLFTYIHTHTSQPSFLLYFCLRHLSLTFYMCYILNCLISIFLTRI